MVLKLDPRHPFVWRSPSSAQLGIDPPLVRLEQVTETQERLLAALAVGVSRPGLTMIARGRSSDVDELLLSVGPALADPSAPDERAVAIVGSGPMADALARGLAGLRRDDSRPDLAILVNHFVTPPALHRSWLRRDVPHLPIVVSDGGVIVGPIVEPGAGPCLTCLELHRRDADPAWPAIATQLLGKTVSVPPVLVLEGAALAARMVLDRFASGPGEPVSARIDAATGTRTNTTWRMHPECGCRGIEHLLGATPGAGEGTTDDPPASAGLPGTGWAGAGPVPLPRRRTS